MTYILRLEPYDFERPAIVLRVLDWHERMYLESLHEQLDISTQHARLMAWYSDAAEAVARVEAEPYAYDVRANYERAKRFLAER